jgi:hypothetical protein
MVIRSLERRERLFPRRSSQQILFRTDAGIEFHAFLHRSEFLFDIG